MMEHATFCPTFCRNKTKSLGLGHDCLRNTRDVPPFRRRRKSPGTRRVWCPRPNCTWPGCFKKNNGSFQPISKNIYNPVNDGISTINLNWWVYRIFWLPSTVLYHYHGIFLWITPMGAGPFGVTKPLGTNSKRHWKWMVGILHSFPSGAKGLFSGANLLLVSESVGIP